jgi:hypothetical protein
MDAGVPGRDHPDMSPTHPTRTARCAAGLAIPTRRVGPDRQRPTDRGPVTAPLAMRPKGDRQLYLAVLTWSFTLFSSARLLAYLPTIWAIQQSGDASQHSLWTWITWLGSNLTMAAWLHEESQRRPSKAVRVNLGNATLCAVVVALIAYHRW